MQRRPSKRSAHVDLWWIDLDAVAQAAANSVVTAPERDRARRYATPELRRRALAARAALRQVLATYLDTPALAVPLVAAPCRRCGAAHGKPALAGRPLEFNLSHAGGTALVAVSDAAVGLDVERIDESRRVDELAPALFSSGDAEAFMRLDAPTRLATFFACWTRKEALVKATGEGLAARDPRTVEVPVEPGPVTTAARLPAAAGDWTITDLRAPDGHRAALAVAGGAPTIEERAWHKT